MTFVCEVRVEVNTQKNKHVFKYQKQKARKKHNMKINKKTFENLEKLTYLWNRPKNKNCTCEEMTSRVNYGNACYHFVQRLSTLRLQSKNIQETEYLVS